jgi:dienelactone hydrolase
MMSKRAGIATAVLAIAFAIAIAFLMRQEHGGPPHIDFELPGNEPATLYMPKDPGDTPTPITPPRADQRPPAVVLVHGFAADRVAMSTLARRLAQNGYAVLAIDLHGHGSNPNPFALGVAEDNVLRDDIRAAVDYLRDSQLVDASRIVVMGHSMGAGAALDYATQDPNIAGVVMISGGFALWGPHRPRNALFILAERDPAFIRNYSIKIAGVLVGVKPPEWGKLYGNYADGTAVELTEVPRVDHVQIIYSARAAQWIIGWLDSINGIRRNLPVDPRDQRRTSNGIAAGLFLLLLIAVGRLTGGFAETWPQRGTAQAWHGLVLLAAALLIAMPLAGIAPMAAVLSMPVANEVVSWFLIAGLIMVAVLWNQASIEGPVGRARPRATLGAAALAFGLIVAMVVPLSVTQHRMALTPERLVMTVLATLMMLPFFYAFELIVRRGSGWQPVLLGLIGRAIVVGIAVLAVRVNAMPMVLGLLIGLFVIQFLLYELFANSAYHASGNLALIAIVESAWMAWLLCATMPMMFAF